MCIRKTQKDQGKGGAVPFAEGTPAKQGLQLTLEGSDQEQHSSALLLQLASLLRTLVELKC